MNTSLPPSKLWRTVGAPTRIAKSVQKRHRRPLLWTCWAIVFVLIVWDIYLARDGVGGNTWSEVLRADGRQHLILPWFLGAIAAHLFHGQDDLRPIVDPDAASTLMGSLALVLILLGFSPLTFPTWFMGIAALLGSVSAYLLWPKLRTGEWNW